MSGSFIDIGWFLGYTLILVAAAHPLRTTAADAGEHDDSSDRSASFLLPYAAITLALAVSTMDMIRTGKWHSLVPWVRTFIIVALVVRQILTLRENTSLTESLEARLTDLGASERRFQGLVRHSSDVVTVLDADGTVQYQSESMQRVFGHSPESSWSPHARRRARRRQRRAPLRDRASTSSPSRSACASWRCRCGTAPATCAAPR